MSPFSIQSILAATDLSAKSDEVLRSCAMLASRSGAELHVISAFALPTSMLSGSEPSEGVIRESEESLDSQLRRVLGDQEKAIASRVVRFGPAGRTIVERADEISADMIALGAHRGGNVAAHFLGTTADAVLRSASAACLVLRGSLHRPISRIGVAMDFSDVAGAALETALAWCEQLSKSTEGAGPSVEVLHVADGTGAATATTNRSGLRVGTRDGSGAVPGTGTGGGTEAEARTAAGTGAGAEAGATLGTGSGAGVGAETGPGAAAGAGAENSGEPTRALDDQLDAAITRAGESAGAGTIGNVTRRVLEARNPAAAIVAWASRENADLIVMGTHGGSGRERAAIGSVSSEVARRAPCAVLLVPPARVTA
jgi:nucleotide-binding universal stress UspA family protein